MYKFFVENNQFEGEKVKIIGEDVNHIKNVLRLNVGENMIICNKKTSQSFICRIEDLKNTEINCSILKEESKTTEAKTYIHLFQGLPKADKLEWIIEKCTELGVKEITPTVMQRTIVKLNEKDKIKKEERWKKIAEVAAKQSQRDSILKVNSIINFKNIFQNLREYDIVLVAYEKETKASLKSVLSTIKNKNKNLKVAVIIGPEGGITEEEFGLCKENNVISVTLGKRILRTETAPIVLASNLLYELED